MVADCSTPADDTEHWVNVADPRLGAEAVFATDEFFGPKTRLLDPKPPVFIPDKYDDSGKWMDGWETRRRRATGHDYCIIRLAAPALIHAVAIDTSHFTGNYPPTASLGACSDTTSPGPSTTWTEILPPTTVQGDARQLHRVSSRQVWTHVRLNIFPDGGVARLRVFGYVTPQWTHQPEEEPVDLIALLNGGRAIACNDSHYGSPNQVLFPGGASHMGDGWETRRRREPGNDWALFALGHPGTVTRAVIDTTHFKGNFPACCSVQAAYIDGAPEKSLASQSMYWPDILPEQPLHPDQEHHFQHELAEPGPITHVRLNLIPDGGLSRFRLFGIPER